MINVKQSAIMISGIWVNSCWRLGTTLLLIRKGVKSMLFMYSGNVLITHGSTRVYLGMDWYT